MPDKFANTPGKRFLKLTGMTARVAGKYTKAKIKNTFVSESNDKEQALSAMYTDIGEQVLQTLGEMKGAAMKIGQIVSQMRHLFPEEFAEKIAQLQKNSPPMSYELIAAQLQAQLGFPPEKLFKHFDKIPYAAASIGQVHRAITHDDREIVVKIQYPGVYESCQSDLIQIKTLFSLSGLLKLDKKTLNSVFATLEKSLMSELDYNTEADNLREFRKFHANDSRIVIPEVIAEYTSERVLCLSYEPGDAMSDLSVLGYTQEQINQSAIVLVEAILQEALFHGRAHSDPHPGNFAFRKDGTLIIYDYGCVAIISNKVIEHYIDIVYTSLDGNFSEVDKMLLDLGVRSPNFPPVDAEVYRSWFNDFIQPVLQESHPAIIVEKIQEGIKVHMHEFLQLRGVFQPNAESIFIDRVITGHFLNMVQMGVNIDLKPIVSAHLFETDNEEI